MLNGNRRATPATRKGLDGSQPASNRTPRRINSNLVLATVRRRQPISRVELARASGLQPSTVSLIVDELLRSSWLIEGDAVVGARGRRPRLLSMSEQKCVIAVDIHPRRTTLALTEMSGAVSWQSVIPLPEEPRQAVDRLIAAVREVARANGHRQIEGMGICLPGRTGPDAADIVFAPNLRWPIVSLKAKLERATGLRVVMDNVANACALSEVWFSESPGAQDLVVVEVSERPRQRGDGRRVRPHPDGGKRHQVQLRRLRLLGDGRLRPRRGALL